jgi:structural maintenance of chromosome 2
VVIGGKNKYMINGKTVQQSEVQNLFHSVQLNVNNPHFLIMQGRITKVLNMKPPEILSMIEEAAGTRMFQTKKEQAMKTIEKKQLKVDELSRCMSEEINPQLDSLKEQRQNYLTYQSNSNELERLERFCVAFQYHEYETMVEEQESGKKAIEDEKAAKVAQQKEKEDEAAECSARIEEMEAQLLEEMKAEFTDLKKNEEDLSKDVVRVKTLHKNHLETLQTEKGAAAALQKQVDTTKASLKEKEAEFQTCSAEFSTKEAAFAEAEKHANTMRDKFQNAVAGVADESTSEVLSLPEQVAFQEKRAREANSQMQQGVQKQEHIKKTLKEKRNAIKALQSSQGQAIKEQEALQKAIATLEGKLQGSAGSLSEAEEAALRAKVVNLQASSRSLMDVIERLTTQLQARLNFEYKDPEKGFDRSKVKGLVAKLVTVTDPKNSTALEVAAGGKLYQVVVDTEQTGKMLLQKGQLRTRVTILPLNKMASRCTDPAKVEYAKELAGSKGGSANLALELVGFDEEVRRAMEYTFGNVIVCDTPEIAKQIAFDRKVRNRTVTLDGDSFDPNGTMSGGAKNELGCMLTKLTELSNAKETLAAQKKELAEAEATLQRIESQGAACKDIEAQLELKRHALKMCEEKLAESSYAQMANEIAALESQLATLEQVGFITS